MKLLAISGSLRTTSNNSALLRALARLAPATISVELYTELGSLPLFNPDLENTNIPVVSRLREKLIAADGVVIASPEYAHGVTGPIKNGLDWMVGCEAFVYKPVALLNASPRAVHAQAALKETLTVMSARLIEAAFITLPILGSRLDEDGLVEHLEIAQSLRQMLSAFQAAIEHS